MPQLRTITLGGAVTGLGIESTSFRNGLPHESVLELDVAHRRGRARHRRPRPASTPTCSGVPELLRHARVLACGCGSSSSRSRRTSRLRNVRFGDLDELEAAIGTVVAGRRLGRRAGGLPRRGGVLRGASPTSCSARWARRRPALSRLHRSGDLLPVSLRDRGRDALTVHDYLWRWDIDWFWCSKAFGAQNPTPAQGVAGEPAAQRRLLPDGRAGEPVRRRRPGRRWRGRPARERVVQDVEVPVSRTAEFLRWFLEHVPMTPVWLCPLRVRGHGGPLGRRPGRRPAVVAVPAAGRRDLRQHRLLGDGPDRARPRGRRRQPRGRGGRRRRSAGTSRSTPTPTTTRPDFWARYGGDAYRPVKQRYDPEGRLLDLYAKAVGRR